MFRQWGLEYALSLLNCSLADYRPIQMIHCILRNKRNLAVYILSETGPGEKYVSYSVPDIYTRVKAPVDPLGDYVVYNMENDPRFHLFFDPVLRYVSMLRVKLFEMDEWVCFIGMWSKEYNAYQPSDVDWVREICHPLGQSVLEACQRDGTFPVIAREQMSGANMIRMCTGLKESHRKMEKCAKTDSTVLITGETGCGKGVMAKAIHELSPRKRRPFLIVNCGAIPENLIESELFGHERGSFTGAFTQHKGAFEQANGGTIFLDEIGELPLLAQAKLLHVLDTHEIVRVGGMQRISLDIRFLAATNRNLKQMVVQGKFRQDLYYRLNVYPIDIPALRQRTEDIFTLTRYYIYNKSKEMGFETVSNPMPGEMEKLLAYTWPGNVRELEFTVERALINAQSPLGMTSLRFEMEDLGLVDHARLDSEKLEEWSSLNDYVRGYLCRALNKTNGQVYGDKGAAALLGIHPNTLKNKIISMGIKIGEPSGARHS